MTVAKDPRHPMTVSFDHPKEFGAALRALGELVDKETFDDLYRRPVLQSMMPQDPRWHDMPSGGYVSVVDR